MKAKSWIQRARLEAGWSIRELVLVVFVGAVLTVLLIPAWTWNKSRTARAVCINNLKQINTGFRLVCNGADSIYPDSIFASTNSGGSESLWHLFQMASGYHASPRVLVCPADSQKTAALDFLPESDPKFSSNSFAHPSRRHASVSYFYALGASEVSPTRLVTGDRHLTRDPSASDDLPSKALVAGAQNLGSATNETENLRWSAEIHSRVGNVTFGDGSARQLTSPKLREALRNSPDPTNRIWLPN